MYSIFFSLALSISLCLMPREASLMSVSPLRNFLKPPPVPETPISTLMSGLFLPNCTATACVIGKTVLEPSIFTVDPSSRFEQPRPPQAAGQQRDRGAEHERHTRGGFHDNSHKCRVEEALGSTAASTRTNSSELLRPIVNLRASDFVKFALSVDSREFDREFAALSDLAIDLNRPAEQVSQMLGRWPAPTPYRPVRVIAPGRPDRTARRFACGAPG